MAYTIGNLLADLGFDSTQIDEKITKFSKFLVQITPKINEAITGFIKFTDDLRDTMIKWQTETKQTVEIMVSQGWYPNWITFFERPDKEIASLDEYMVDSLSEEWDELTTEIISMCPNRKAILEDAFKLHKEGVYNASIPLFFTQADGICSEEFTHFFTKDRDTRRNASEEIIKQIEEGELNIDIFTEHLIEPFKVKSNISKQSSVASKTEYINNGPNRHGIIHGNIDHLNYGTEVNSYKAFSFLAFIVFTCKDRLPDARV
ncbi:MAG: hypothetical protein OCD01_19520 [Fibrobacterales bacterium]